MFALLAEFTVAAIWKSYEQFVLPYVDKKLSCDLFVSGGGARNPTLMRQELRTNCSMY